MMKAAFLCFLIYMMFMGCDAATVFVSVAPGRSQFFKYDHFSVSCEGEEEPAGRRVMQRMKDGEVKAHLSPYSVSAAFPDEHTGVYWCEAGRGANSSDVFVTVTDGSVMLDSPALPVAEGGDVTLSCRCKTSDSADSSCGPAEFYKDGIRIESSSTGDMAVHSVSGSDQGFYKCKVNGSGESPESRLTVRAPSPTPPAPSAPSAPSAPLLPVSTLVRHLIVGAPYLLSTIILGLVYRDRRKHQRDQPTGQRRTRDEVIMQIIS
ncbi:Fc receptor-like A [Kryptolebias marmoratus]|uniref:Fc receptor-like A n=1 Tax=Kryptolebias marmoratus TaxID=37003 RepID=UPI000D52FC86|nr:Fc receptor-like A [Kryptolebias marmoratus]